MSTTANSTGTSMASDASIDTTATADATSEGSLSMPLEIAAATSFVRAFLTKQLRDQFPFLATAALGKLVENATKTIRDGLEEAEPAMVASKGRSNFFTLPPELRNRILGPVLEESPLSLAVAQCDIHGACVKLPGESINLGDYNHLAARYHDGCKHVRECVEADCVSTCEPKKHQRLVKPTALLQICRKLRAEVAPMFFGGKTFHFEISTFEYGIWIKDWLKLIGPELACLIDKIHVVIKEPQIDDHLENVNFKKHYKKAVKRGKRYKEVWGKKGLLGSLGLLGLGVPVERFEVSTYPDSWGEVEVKPWEQEIKPDYSPFYVAT